MHISYVLHGIVIAVCIAVLLYVAWQDFLTFRIANASVLILIALAVVELALDDRSGLWRSLAIAGGLFLLGVVFWAIGMMGAGDAKLFFPVGLLVNWNQLMVFAVVLLVLSFAAAFVMALPLERKAGRRGALGRLAEIKAAGEFPFGVPISLAAIAALLS